MLEWILSSIGLYGIGKRENVKAAALAWVPGFQGYVQGALADAHDKEHGRKDRKWRVVALVLDIISVVCGLIAVVIGFGMLGEIIELITEYVSAGAAYSAAGSFDYSDISELGMDYEQFFGRFGASFITLYMLLIPMAVVESLRSVFGYITLYKTFDLCKPSSVIATLICSILFGGLGRAIALLIVKDYRNDEVFNDEVVSDSYEKLPAPEQAPEQAPENNNF